MKEHLTLIKRYCSYSIVYVDGQNESISHSLSLLLFLEVILTFPIFSSDSKIEIKLVNEKTRAVEVTNVKSIIVKNSYDVSIT